MSPVWWLAGVSSLAIAAGWGGDGAGLEPLLAVAIFPWMVRSDEATARVDALEADLAASREAINALLLDRDDGAALWVDGRLAVAAGAAAPLQALAHPDNPIEVAVSLAAPDYVATLTERLETLFESGRGFELAVVATDGRRRRIAGRVMGARVFVRLFDEGSAAAQPLPEQLERAQGEVARLRQSIDAAPMLVWYRDASGGLAWVNEAYAVAVGASAEQVVADSIELAAPDDRNGLQRLMIHAFETGKPAEGVFELQTREGRKSFRVTEVRHDDGTVGMALDIMAQVTAQTQLQEARRSRLATFDRMGRGAAVFSRDLRLLEYNERLLDIWRLERDWLDEHPGLRDVLSQLRAKGRVPEQRDFRAWRQDLIADLSGISEPRDMVWHMSGGGVMNVYCTPEAGGGVQMLFEDATDLFALKRDIATVAKVQRAAFSRLNDAVLVVGLDGRVRLCNNSFLSMWQFGDRDLREVHLREVVVHASKLHDDPDLWPQIMGYVSAAGEAREAWRCTIQRGDGRVLSLSTAALPDGASMFAFADITDSFETEKALTERARALAEASSMKTEFLDSIHKTSQSLRIPLNTIIGFSQILDHEMYGTLNDSQREYVDGIQTAANDLRQLVGGVVDLAKIQADGVDLQIEPVNLIEMIETTLRFLEKSQSEPFEIVRQYDRSVGAVPADPPRLREIVHTVANALLDNREGESALVLSVARDDTTATLSLGLSRENLPRIVRRCLLEPDDKPAIPAMTTTTLHLTLIRQFALRHGADIALDERPDGLCQISFRFLLDESDVRRVVSTG